MNPISPVALPLSMNAVQSLERTLVDAARHDPAAFAQLYRAHLRSVYHYALAHVGNGAEAQDITSQTFLAALEGIDHFRGESRFSTWLFGIARNKCADYFRRRRATEREMRLIDAEEEPAPGPPPEDLIQQTSRFEEVARQIGRLPADQVEALSLRVFGGLSADEVGQIMGRSGPAIKMLVHRALQTLKTRLEDWREVP